MTPPRLVQMWIHDDAPELPPAGPLKPCPFDGGTRLVVRKTPRFDLVAHPEWADDPDAYAYNVHCTSCAADGPWKKTQSGAEQMWNGIPAPDARSGAKQNLFEEHHVQ